MSSREYAKLRIYAAPGAAAGLAAIGPDAELRALLRGTLLWHGRPNPVFDTGEAIDLTGAARVQLYGIPNCDTVKKARAWLDQRGIEYLFHDYKKEGAEPAKLSAWSDAIGWEPLLNRRGMTFRGLPDADKTDIDRAKAFHLMQAHPSLIKRPVVEHGTGVLVGFDPLEWERVLG